LFNRLKEMHLPILNPFTTERSTIGKRLGSELINTKNCIYKIGGLLLQIIFNENKPHFGQLHVEIIHSTVISRS